MPLLRRIIGGFRGLFQRTRVEQELDAELQDFLETAVEQKVQTGLSREQATRAARMELGSVEAVKDRVRDIGWESLIENCWQDVRYASRMLRKSPGFAAVAVLSLALGIGANTAIFSIVDGVLLNPIPYAEPDRLVSIYGTNANGTKNSISYPNFLDWQRDNQTFETLAAWRGGSFSLTGNGDPEFLTGQMVSANFFSVLRVQPLFGRVFRAEEDRLGAAPVVVLGEGLWKRRFAANPNIVGTSITLNGKAHTVIGVMPQSVRLLNAGTAPFNDAFTPLGQYDQELFRNRGVNDGTQGLARLKTGVTLAEARADMATIAGRLATAYPEANKGVGVNILTLKEDLVGDVTPIVVMLLVSVGLVLLIACANVANLLLARATTRAHEFALRAALGAGRGRIIRQLLSESVLLSIIGGAGGLLVAILGTQSVLNVFPSALPGIAQVAVNGRILGASLTLAVFTGILFGLVPAISAAQLNLHDSLKVRATAARPGRRAAQNLFVVTQVALTLVLLAATGLMIRSLIGLLNADPGFNPRNVLTFYTRLSPEHASSPAKVRAAFLAIEEKLRAVPGVESASVDIGALPFSGGVTGLGFWRADKPRPVDPNDRPEALFYAVGTDYFATMGIPLRRGRSFMAHDDSRARHVMLVDEELARAVFPNEDPIGKRIRIGAFNQQEIEIVGVVGHVKHHGLVADDTATVRSQFYVPHMQLHDVIAPLAADAVAVMIKSPLATQSLVPSIRRELTSFDPTQAIVDARRMDDVVAKSLAGRRFSLLVLGMFAAIALVLSIVGIYGVVTHLVGQRTREFGVRLALGAPAGDVLRNVLGYGLRLALAGSVVGVGVALTLSGLLRSLLYGVSPTDPATIVTVTALLLGVTVLACYVPARRATRVDPLVALRAE
jgi:putative ABC transport system permease protein